MDAAMAQLDKDGNGTVEFSEFLDWWQGGKGAKRLCAEKDDYRGKLPLHLALEHEAPEGVVLAIIDAHPQVTRHAESRRTKGGVLPSWPPYRRFLALGSGLGLVGTVSARR